MKLLLPLAVVALAMTAIPVAADPPEQALFGLCTAWGANENGREHGNAENAPPFQGLQNQAEQANQTVEEFCADVPHPGNGGGNGNGNGGGNGGGNGNGPPL